MLGQFLAQKLGFWQFGPSRLDSHYFFGSISLGYVEKSYFWTQIVTSFLFDIDPIFQFFQNKNRHQLLNHFWGFWQFGPPRLDSQELFAPAMLIYVAGSYTWTQKVTIFDFNFELRFLANSSPSPENLSKPHSCILNHDASLCIIMMILIHDSWSWNTANNESICITMHHGHEPWCIVMYHDDQSPSTSTCSTFPNWGDLVHRDKRETSIWACLFWLGTPTNCPRFEKVEALYK